MVSELSFEGLRSPASAIQICKTRKTKKTETTTMAAQVAAMDVEGAGANDAPQKRDSGVLNFITHIIPLEHDIASAMQGGLSVVDYFTKLQMLWDELVQLRPLPECTCGSACTCNVAKATTDLIEERHLMQFLMGLNDEYDNVRS
ncbi:UNVERIFIED_CONTAM: hypothetical protein Sradi_4025900 [Sesamum radiatum]|uniref:Retrotransposon gag domain-containing protein n=1 Tax=Sesamum radiatum TaxID=300843 RepID=A0AAW2PHZ8_SESRA